MRVMGLVLVLGGCAAAMPVPPSAPAPSGREARVAAECRMLAQAHAETLRRGLAAPPDILVGCPGHEALRDAMPLAAQTAALRAANAAVLPPEVAASGVRGARIYRRMITRGVPEAVAGDVARGPLFAAAAKA